MKNHKLFFPLLIVFLTILSLSSSIIYADTFSGYVFDDTTSSPISGAVIAVGNGRWPPYGTVYYDTTDPQGYYEVTGIPDGNDYTILASAIGYISKDIIFQTPPDSADFYLTKPSSGFLVETINLGLKLYQFNNIFCYREDGVVDTASSLFPNIEAQCDTIDSLFEAIGAGMDTTSIDSLIYQKCYITWNWLCNNACYQPWDSLWQEAISFIMSEGWPSIERIAKTYMIYGFIPWGTCMSRSQIFSTLLYRTGISKDIIAIAVTRWRLRYSQHMYLLIFLDKRWFHLDPSYIYYQCPSYGEFHSIPWGVSMNNDHSHPYEINIIPGSNLSLVPVTTRRMNNFNNVFITSPPDKTHILSSTIDITGISDNSSATEVFINGISYSIINGCFEATVQLLPQELNTVYARVYEYTDSIKIIRDSISFAEFSPVLIFPFNNSTEQPTSIPFTWFHLEHAETYNLQVSEDSSFTSIFFNDSTITDTLHQIDSLLTPMRYYWRVKAKNIAGVSSDYSEIWNFTTINDTPIVLQPITDVIFDEDTGPHLIIANLDSIFYDSPPDSILSYSAVSQNPEIQSNIAQKQLIISSTQDYFGYGDVFVIATDSSGLYVSDTFLVTIKPVNDSPVVSIPDTNFYEDDTLILDLDSYAYDIDDPDSLLEWSYSIIVGGKSPPMVIVKSKREAQTHRDRNLTTKNKNFKTGATFSVAAYTNHQLQIVDSRDGPVYVDIDSITHIATITADPDWCGYRNIIFTAQDTLDLSDCDTMEVTVIPINDPPVIDSFTPETVCTTWVDSIISFYVYANDVDSNILTYSWFVNGIFDTTTLEPAYSYTGYGETTDTVKTIVSDGSLVDSIQWVIVVGLGVEEEQIELPQVFFLSQNFPNPFSKKTVISYQLPVISKVSLRVYDLSGRLVITLVDEEKKAGYYTVKWSSIDKNLAPGIYFIRMSAGTFIKTRKMISIR